MSGAATPEKDERYAARTVLTVLGSLGGATLATVWLLIWAFTTGLGFAAVVGLMVAITVLFLAPVIVFALVGGWSYAPSREGTRYLHRAYWISGSLAVVSAVTVIAFGVVARPWTWVPVSTIIISAVFFAVAVILGRALRSPKRAESERDIPEVLVLEPWTPGQPSKVRLAIVVLPSIFLLAAALASLAFRPWSPGGSPAFRRVFFASTSLEALSIAFVATAIACLPFSFSALNRVGRTIRRSFPLRKRALRAIAKNDVSGLDPLSIEAARRYASDSARGSAWALIFWSLLGLGVTLQQVSSSLEPDSPFGPWAAIGIGFIYVFVIASWGVRRHRGERFLRKYGDPTPDLASQPPQPAPVS